MSLIWTPRQNILIQADATLSSTDSDFSAPFSSSVGFRVHTDGTVDRLSGGSWVNDYTYVIPQAASGLVWCRVTSVSFDPAHSWAASPGADGTWFQVSSTREWRIDDTTEGTQTSTATLQFALSDGGTVLASTDCTLQVVNTP